MHLCIENNELTEIQRLVRLFNFDPHEEISQAGHFWTALHYACYLDKAEILEYFIGLTYRKHKEQFQDIINMQTSNQQNPIMVAATKNAKQSLKMLFKYGGIDISVQDLQGKSLMQLAMKFGDEEFREYLDTQLALNDFQEIIPMKINNLENFPQYETYIDIEEYEQVKLSKEQQIKYRDLLLKGEQNHCIICLSNSGYLQYTNCCGHPMHSVCQPQSKEKCPMCSRKSYKLIDQVLFPERAFSFPQNN